MSGKLGVTASKAVLTTVKFAIMAILQKVQRDGFQPADLLAPLDSAEFRAAFEAVLKDVALILPEIQELDGGDKFSLLKHLYDCVKDIRTEWNSALVKLASIKKPV